MIQNSQIWVLLKVNIHCKLFPLSVLSYVWQVCVPLTKSCNVSLNVELAPAILLMRDEETATSFIKFHCDYLGITKPESFALTVFKVAVSHNSLCINLIRI